MFGRKPKPPKEPMPPLKQWLHVVAIGWLLPGGGHFFLKRRGRGAILLGCVVLTFLFGLLMRGAMFKPETGDMLTTIIYCGGFIANVSAGLLYLVTLLFGYAQADVAGHVHDYGTKFLVAAGLMNILAMVDAFEIAVGRKS
ncbi:MAG: DUF6677 family protein [Bryobacteraceae bacterium]